MFLALIIVIQAGLSVCETGMNHWGAGGHH